MTHRIVVSHAYSLDNKGDAALLSVLIDDLRAEYPDADLTVLTLDEVPPGGEIQGAAVVPSLMRYALDPRRSRPGKLLCSLGMVVSTLVWAFARRLTGVRLRQPVELRPALDAYAHADLVVGVGGGYLRGRRTPTSTVELLLLVHPLWLTRILRVPTVLYNCSVGPVHGPVQRGLLRSGLDSVDTILMREDVTAELVQDLGVATRAVRSIDSGFTFTSDAQVGVRARLGLGEDRLLVGITVRDWLVGAAQESYEAAVAEMADHLISVHDAHVVFVPQVTSLRNADDDRTTSGRVWQRLRHREAATVWEHSPDAGYVKAMISELDLMCGTRFHSVIFALTSGVPALAISYEHKTDGIMADLDLEQWVVDIDRVTGPALVGLADRLVAERAEYAAHLQDRLPGYVAAARRSRDELRRAHAPAGSAGTRR